MARKHPGLIQWRGSGWRVSLRVDGKQYWFGARVEPILRHGSRSDVIEWCERKYKELQKAAKREAEGQLGRIHFSQLVEQYEAEEVPTLSQGTRDAYEDSLKPLRHYFLDMLGDPMIDQVHARHVKAFLSWRRSHRPDGTTASPPLSTRTLAKDRAVLHRLFDFADRMEYRDGNPVKRVEPPKGDSRQPVILTPVQWEALLAGCEDPVVRLFTLTCGETGARCESEVLWLRFEDIDLDGGFVTFVSGRGHRTKTGRTRHCPLTPRLRDAMREHFAARRFAGSPWVFHHERTRRHYKRGQRVQSYRRAVLGALKRANVALRREEQDPIPGGWTMHDLRHRRCTVWLAEGKSPVLVKEALGHADLRTTMGYTHLVKEHLRALVEEPATAPAARSKGA